MRFLILLALAVVLHAEDTKPLATVEELTKQVAEQQNLSAEVKSVITQALQQLKADHEQIELLKADNAWLDKDRQIAYATFQACMGQRPSQAQQRQRIPEKK